MPAGHGHEVSVEPLREDSQVTVVVMTRDRLPDLRRSLPRHEGPVILVDNGSRDGTPTAVRREFPHVRVVELGENHGAGARNIGVELACTPYIAFADDDSWWAPGALEVAADLFDRYPRMALLAGQVLVGPDHQLDPICLLLADSPLGTCGDLPGPNILGFLACGSVVRRSAYLDVGGFDDVVFFAGEEERLALDLASAGWGLAYVDKVVAHHHPSDSRQHHRRQVRAARNRILTTLLRRPWPVVVRAGLTAVRSGRAGREGAWQALKRSPHALAQRRVVPAHVERARRLLDHRSG